MKNSSQGARRGKSKPVTLGRALRASSGDFLATGIFSFFINLLMLTGPLFMLQIYDRVLSSRSVPTLLLLFGLVAGLFVFLGFLELVRSRILSRIGANVYERVNKRVFDLSMLISLQTGGDNQAGKPLQDLNILQQYISGPGPATFFDFPWVPAYLFIIFMFHNMLGILALVAAILLFIIALLNDVRARKPTQDAAMAASEGAAFADAGRRNAEVLAAMGMQRPIRDRWESSQSKALEHQTKGRDRAGTLTAISKSLRLFLQSAMLALGAYLVILQEVTPGTMIAASIILGRALQPVEQAIAHWRGFVQARQAFGRLNGLLKRLPPENEKMELPRPEGRVDVKGLAVAAPGVKQPVLRNVSFSIEPGTIMGVEGNSGGGKSTLARALVGVWPALGGEVRIDGSTPSQWDPQQLGQYIGYLPQDVELFGGRINENIARFQTDFDANEVIRAAQLAGVDQLIKHIGGYDKNIGHTGSNLSAGQRQRIALARALYKTPSLIVLDEPNSNLDDDGDAALSRALAALKANRQTVVIISHREAILDIADYLLVIENGMQIDFGPRDLVRQREAIRKQGAGKPPPPAPQSPAPKAGNGAVNGNGTRQPNGKRPADTTQVNISVGTPQWPINPESASKPLLPVGKPARPNGKPPQPDDKV